MGRIGSEGDEWRRLDRKGMSCVGSDGNEMGWEGLGRRGMREGLDSKEMSWEGLDWKEMS